jgi:hypothetical protein
MLRIMAGRIDQIEETLATLRSFITEAERPQTGEDALKKIREKRGAADEKEGRARA